MTCYVHTEGAAGQAGRILQALRSENPSRLQPELARAAVRTRMPPGTPGLEQERWELLGGIAEQMRRSPGREEMEICVRLLEHLRGC